MKTIFFILFTLPILALFINSCDEDTRPKAPESKRMELDSTSQFCDQNYRTYTLEGCEYVVFGYGNTRWGSHKGNCKNPIHYDLAVCETGDTTLYQEKHFDCYVADCYFDKQMNSYAVTTECGILFYGSKHKVNEVLKDFKSPKHE